MISIDKKNKLLQALDSEDHVYIIDNFIKSKTSSIYHKTVQNILKKYVTDLAITIVYSQNGRPYLTTSSSHQNIFFSLTHKDNLLLLLISLDEEIGIDVEFIKLRPLYQTIAARYFKKNTLSVVDFYRHWTAREAFIKAKDGRLFRDMATIFVLVNGDSFRLGYSEFTHEAIFFAPKSQFLAAYCRPITSHKILKSKYA